MPSGQVHVFRQPGPFFFMAFISSRNSRWPFILTLFHFSRSSKAPSRDKMSWFCDSGKCGKGASPSAGLFASSAAREDVA